MNICVITASLSQGGASAIAMDIAMAMVKRKNKCSVITAGNTNYSGYHDGVRIQILKNYKPNIMYHYFNPLLMIKLYHVLKKVKPDVIHIHTINLKSFSLLSLFFSYYFPVVWTLHDVWPLCIAGWPDLPDCNGINDNCAHCPKWPRWMVKINKLLKETTCKLINIKVISPSQWLADIIKNSSLKIDTVDVVYNGIDENSFYKKVNSRKKLGISNDKIVILFCGGKKIAGQMPAYRKGWVYLCKALKIIGKKYKNLALLFVGDRIDLPRDFSIPTIFAEGISRKCMPDYYNASDMLVLPTLADNLALTVLEAMACKLPIIATITGGIPEVIINDYNGLICPPRNAGALAEMIETLISNPAHGARMAEQGYKIFLSKFRLDHMIDQYENAYRDAIASFHKR